MQDEKAPMNKGTSGSGTTTIERVIIMDVPIDAITTTEVIDMIFDIPKTTLKRGKHIVTINPEMVLAAQKDREFMHILQNTDLNTADGNGLLWAANTQKKSRPMSLLKLLTFIFKKPTTPLPQLIKGSDLVLDIAKYAAQTGDKIFLLGAKPGVAGKAKANLEKMFPGVQIVGTYHGSPEISEEREIKNMISKTEPDILLVAYGAPAQEKWIARNLHEMPSVRVAIGVGGTFDYLSGKIKRAPMWMQRIGIEWLHRLIREPRRLKRIVNAIIVFPIKIIGKKNRVC